MLFNSHIFVFVFLPIVLLGYWLATVNRKQSDSQARGRVFQWIILASIFFYSYWNPIYILLLGSSIAVNYWLGQKILNESNTASRTHVLWMGIAFNLSVLIYFKYTSFILQNLNASFGTHFDVPNIVLPLAISFITFQKIAFLVDCFYGRIKKVDFVSFLFFVTFFPQLISGPIVHYRDLEPQTRSSKFWQLDFDRFSKALTLFLFGLFKKVALADSLAPTVDYNFDTIKWNMNLDFFESWRAALGYALQIYFDFSGYSTMALGLALFFGLKLPINFQSPYQSKSLIEFWKRWHISLSQFLRDYLYIPLGGNRKGPISRYVNLMITMLLGGLWHGAGWNFVIWGAIHGLGLCFNHAWRNRKASNFIPNQVWEKVSWLATFVFVVFAWIPFRADSMNSTIRIWKGMLGFYGVALPIRSHYLDTFAYFLQTTNWAFYFHNLDNAFVILQFTWLFLLILFCVRTPTAEKWIEGFSPDIKLGFAFGIFLFYFVQTFFVGVASEFIYFQF